MLYLIRALLLLLILLANTAFWILPLMLFAVLKLLSPTKNLRKLNYLAVRQMASNWAVCVNWVFKRLTPTRFVISGQEELRQDESVLVLSNHQTWVDIPVLMQSLHGKTPFYTFFLKKELIWLPFIGLACWALEFPFVRRYSKAQIAANPELKGKDLEITKKACQRLEGIPVALINFVEGTRFTPTKHQEQNSPYQYLLKPKSGGVAFALAAMGEQLTSYLNITLVYPKTNNQNKQPNFIDLLAGRIEEVQVYIEKRPLPKEFFSGDYQNDPAFRAEFQEWISSIWQEKDTLMANQLKN